MHSHHRSGPRVSWVSPDRRIRVLLERDWVYLRILNVWPVLPYCLIETFVGRISHFEGTIGRRLLARDTFL
jgi:hypothetical protein